MACWSSFQHEFGFCFVTGVPPTPEDTEALIRRIGNIRETHCEHRVVVKLTADGGYWDFTSNMSHGDLAYSSEGLPAHTDTTYFTDPAGLQIFHMLSHPCPPGSGGSTLLVDSFYTASIMASLHPTSYSLLSRLRIPAHASGTEGTLLRPIVSQPVLRHDSNGELVQVRWNNEDRGVLGIGWRPEEVKGWYEAARQWEMLGRSEDAEYWVQLAPGTVVGKYWLQSDANGSDRQLARHAWALCVHG
jgi:trimethyllysine dioxygenase